MPVLWRVYEIVAVLSPEAGDERLVVGDADVLDGDRGHGRPAHPQVDPGADGPLHAERDGAVARVDPLVEGHQRAGMVARVRRPRAPGA